MSWRIEDSGVWHSIKQKKSQRQRVAEYVWEGMQLYTAVLSLYPKDGAWWEGARGGNLGSWSDHGHLPKHPTPRHGQHTSQRKRNWGINLPTDNDRRLQPLSTTHHLSTPLPQYAYTPPTSLMCFSTGPSAHYHKETWSRDPIWPWDFLDPIYNSLPLTLMWQCWFS